MVVKSKEKDKYVKLQRTRQPVYYNFCMNITVLMVVAI